MIGESKGREEDEEDEEDEKDEGCDQSVAHWIPGGMKDPGGLFF